MANWTPEQFREYAKRRMADALPKPITEHEANTLLGAVAPARPERNKVQTLGGTIKARRQRKGGMEPRCRVLLIACRQRELDDDSNIYSLKALRDAVSASLGVDDADARIRFEYGQCLTQGESGVIVKIEPV